MTIDVQTITLAGQRFVIVPETKYQELTEKAGELPLPPPDADGNYPAVASARILLARKLLRRRRAVGLTQAQLAKRAGVRVETLSRLEHGKHSPNVTTVDKIVRALKKVEAR